LFYECVVGHLPFEGSNPAQVLRRVLEGIYPTADRERGTVGKRWSAILDRALAKNAADRYESATAMRDAIARELARVGVTQPRAELEAWCKDPDAYVKEHDAKTIAKLCELGRAASAKGDAIAAAADYNRALAYAPHDQALMKIVAGLHRVDARRRIVRRVAPMLAAMVLFGVVAFFVTKALRVRATDPAPSPTTSATSVSPVPSVPASATATASAAPPTTATATSTVPQLRVPPIVKPIERSVVIASVSPPYGVLVSLDGAGPVNATSGLRLAIDGKAHDLAFKCVNDMCEPQTRSVAAGDEPEPTIAVKLQLKPAKLVVDGDPTMSYGLEEFPDIEVRAGLAAIIPVNSGNAPVHIVERPSGHRLTTTLNPGQERRVSFLGDAGR
jgi:serine/threonine-protein kinase